MSCASAQPLQLSLRNLYTPSSRNLHSARQLVLQVYCPCMLQDLQEPPAGSTQICNLSGIAL